MAKNDDTNKIVMFDTENSIILGDYLDLLLNRTLDAEEVYGDTPRGGVYYKYTHKNSIQSTVSKLGQYEYIRYAKKWERLEQPEGDSFIYSGGIRIPHYHKTEKVDEGSGNMVILGKPGVGKSTLAFQFAAACASQLNNGIAVYFSLDVDEKQIVKSMKRSDDELRVNFLCAYRSVEEKGRFVQHNVGSNEELERMFRKVLYKNKEGKTIPQIVLPKLSPRGICPNTDTQEDVIFLQRIGELQKLLRAISTYNDLERRKEDGRRGSLVKLVVIDSLDVFGEKILTSEEINRLFMLFKQYGIIGVFTMGFVGNESLTSEAAYRSAVTYQADVVIELKKEFYNNYTCSYFEIVKSRYVRHVLGRHPYKVDNYQTPIEKEIADRGCFQNTGINRRIAVLPSLHHRISASENSALSSAPVEKNSSCPVGNIFGIEGMMDILPNHFKGRDLHFPQIITISGESGLYKSDIALNALISGIIDSEQNGLIVRLGDRDAFTVRGVRFEDKLLSRAKKICLCSKDEGNRDCIYFPEWTDDSVYNDEPNKYALRGWSVKNKAESPELLEVTFKNGALLPEEFVDEICRIINRYQIKRVAFIDLKYIGSSYPFLVNSDTSGKLFLSAFVHIMRNYGMHVIMSSSKSGLEDSDEELSKANILADAILNCTVQIKNGKYQEVFITGEGLITRKEAKPVVTIDEKAYKLKFCNGPDDKENEKQNGVELCPFHIGPISEDV